MFRRKHLLVVVALVFAVMTTLLGQVLIAYHRSPTLVAALEGSRSLPMMSSSLTPRYLCALLQVQDPTFLSHHGVGLMHGSPGHTTITQAVCKVLFFPEGFRPGFLRNKKVRLMLIALAFDRRISKDTQLRLFLNLTYMGTINGVEVTGFAEAATRYFQKPFRELSEREYLSLLAMLDGPNRFNPLAHPNLNATRVKEIERVMATGCQ